MKHRTILTLAIAIAVLAGCSAPNEDKSGTNDAPGEAAPTKAMDARRVADAAYPERVYWGDQHVHTEWSADAGLAGATLSPEVIPFFAFSPEVRRILYTTNAIESLHSQVRKAIRNKGDFPSDESATKLIYLALRNIAAKWKRPPKEWHAAKVQLAIQFPDRFTVAA
jgi:hypothetical protein